MIQIQIDNSARLVVVKGHTDDGALCGAVTMLLRAAAMICTKVLVMDGFTMIEFEQEGLEDFAALQYGLECIAQRERLVIDATPYPDRGELANPQI